MSLPVSVFLSHCSVILSSLQFPIPSPPPLLVLHCLNLFQFLSLPSKKSHNFLLPPPPLFFISSFRPPRRFPSESHLNICLPPLINPQCHYFGIPLFLLPCDFRGR